MLERDYDFAQLLHELFAHLPNFDVIEGDVRDLGGILADRGVAKADAIVSGLPVPSFPKELERELFRNVGRVLDDHGIYSQITEMPLVYWRFYQRFFQHVRFAFEPRNFPPAGGQFLPRREACLIHSLVENAMQGDALLSRIAGHDLVRSQVNRGYAAYARRRVARLEFSDPVAVQEHTLKRLVRGAAHEIRPRSSLCFD